MKKLIAMLGAVVAAVTSAWAATPVAVWEGDFKTTTKGSVSLDLQGNTVADDESGTTITIANGATKGVKFSWATGRGDYTIIAKVSSLASNTTKAQAIVTGGNNGNRTGIALNTDGNTKGIWDGNLWANASYVQKAAALSLQNGYIAARHKSADGDLCGTYLFQNTGSGWGSVYEANGCRSRNDASVYKTISLGGPVAENGGYTACAGMVIEKVAIFHAPLTSAEIAEYVFPGDITIDYTRWAQNPATFTLKKGADFAFHKGIYTVFDLTTGKDTETSYTGTDTNVSGIPGQSGSVGSVWQIFSSASKSVAPGYAIRLVPEYAGQYDAQYNNLAFGGMIVTPGATGYSFVSNGSNNTAGKENANRPTDLGNNSTDETVGAIETWFQIYENITFSREGAFSLWGTINFDIANGRVFDLNSARNNANDWYAPTIKNGGTLKMHGKGTLNVYKLIATQGATLDFSDVSSTRTSPYINGIVKIDDTTKFVLPADYSIGSVYKIATSIDSSVAFGTVYVENVTIGETLHENVKVVVLSDGNIAVLNGDDATDNLSAGIFCLYDWTFNGTIASVGQNKLTLSWDTGFHDGEAYASERFVEGETYDLALNAKATPYCPDNATITYPTEWTCFVAGVAPSNVGGGLIVFGTTSGGAIGLVTTGEDKVALVRTTGDSKYTSLEEMTVPGAQTTSHAYTFVKTASAITVYLDGNVISQKAVSNATFGNKLQVGSIHGGTRSTGINKATSGSIQAVRIMNGVQPAATIRAFSNEFPYHSPNGTYGRTFEAGEQSWNAEDAWTSTKDEGNVAEPGAGLVQANFSGATTVSVNLAADVTYESLTINNNESGVVTFAATEGTAGVIKAAQMTVNAPIVLGEGAVDLSKGPLTLGEEGSITFDFSGLTYAGAVAAYPFVEKVTGVVTQNDEKFILKAPAENDDFSLELRYNEGDSYYEVAATYKKLVEVTIPTIDNTSATVSVGEKTVEIVGGKVTVPATANLTVTYSADANYHMGETTTATVSNVQEGSTVDTTGIEALINTYSARVVQVVGAITKVSLNDGAEEVVETDSITVNHGTKVVINYYPAAGYELVQKEDVTVPSGMTATTGYKYSSVVANITADYTIYFDAVPLETEIPGEELIDSEEKEAYRAWAETNGVTAETTTDPSVLAIAFHLGATISEGVTIEKAAQAKVKDLLKDIDLVALAGEGGEKAALTALNTALKAKGLVASLAPVTLTGASESTKLYKLVIKLTKENT